MANLSSLCTEMKQFIESFPDDEIDSILKEGSEFLDSYLDAAAEKFKKKRGRKLKNTTIDTKVEIEQNPLLLSHQENEPEFKRPTRTASKIASHKMKNDLLMPLSKKLRRVEDGQGNYIIHSNQSILSNLNIKQERISEELDTQDELGASEFENPNSTCSLMQAIEDIVQSTPPPVPALCMSSLETNIEQKHLILNTPVLLDKNSSKLDSGINIEFHSDGSDKEAKTKKKSKRTNTIPKKNTDDSTSSVISTFSSPPPPSMRVTRTKTRALANSATLYSDLESFKENISSAKKCKDSPLKQEKIISNGNFHNTHKDTTTINKNSKLPLALNNTCITNWSKTMNNGNQPSKVGMIVSHLESFITKQKPAQIPLATKQLEDAQAREEKAAEAEKKKERLLKEKVENQKRINEAKQLKVQQAREQMELQKKEKLRQLQIKKAEALKKQKELERSDSKEKFRLQEHHKKELALAKSTAEQEIRNEKSKLEKMNPQVVIQKVQADLNATYTASSDKTADPSVQGQIFGKNDIYSGESSEEEEERISKKIFPEWTLPDNRRMILRIQSQIPFDTIKKFIVCGEQTPDLTKIFRNIPKRALTRTSSAVWNSPPIHSLKYN